MADITGFTQGEVDDSGKVNWRGDQVTVTPGGQSIYKSSSVQLAQLGARKVVGDRVFRYALAAGTIEAGNVAEWGGEALKETTAGATGTAGDRTFTWYAATAMSANTYAEGYLMCNSGAASTAGSMYRIKSHDAIAKTSTGTLYLYDPLAVAITASAEYTVVQNLYKVAVECTTGAGHVMIGVSPIRVVSGDYFWLQTWGPAGCKASALSAGNEVMGDDTGEAAVYTSAAADAAATPIGQAMQAVSASEYGVVFLRIAP